MDEISFMGVFVSALLALFISVLDLGDKVVISDMNCAPRRGVQACEVCYNSIRQSFHLVYYLWLQTKYCSETCSEKNVIRFIQSVHSISWSVTPRLLNLTLIVFYIFSLKDVIGAGDEIETGCRTRARSKSLWQKNFMELFPQQTVEMLSFFYL